jgi:hypothetical protein
MASPFNVEDRPLIEVRSQPLYDCDVLSTRTTFIDFFQIPRGHATVAGTVAVGANVMKTLRHTNMTQGGFLPNPKLFKVEGIRLSLSEAPQDKTSTPSTVLNVLQADHVQIMLEEWLRYNMWFEFRVGSQKPYAVGPGFFFPANRGIGMNVAAVSLGQRVEGNGLGITSEAITLHGAGLYWSLGRNTVTIGPNQSFRARLRNGGLTLHDNTFAVIANINSDSLHRLCYCWLDGLYGVEVQ